MKKASAILLVAIFAAISVVSRGATYELAKTGTEVKITGTSSVHDWEMIVNVSKVGMQVTLDGSSLKSIENVTFSCKATDIKSDNNLMDKKTYEALKADAFPEIKFTSASTSDLIIEGKKFKGSLKGKLNVAGQVRDVIIPFTGTINENNTLTVTAALDISMSTYNITPPTAMLGALKTGDKVTVAFSLQFIQKS